ncbi:MAG: Lrp/AsnC family transcriptional regulator [Spirochaetales bacterium]|jgi:DNA-binding Lrp family transcriptional regulator|nr:Lrp/AsnC family transcriptional regulator [Exilispira sp.]NMC68074.1 Lrp/AsnC family transcriptional regulator [Spirochaetales bacterium]
MDARNKKILEILQKNGRITNKEIAEQIYLSPPSVLERVKKLETDGVILGYKALLNRKAIGRPILAFTFIMLSNNSAETITSVLKYLSDIPELLEVYHLTGRFDFLVKTSATSLENLNEIISEKISKAPGIQKVETSLVLDADEKDMYPIE